MSLMWLWLGIGVAVTTMTAAALVTFLWEWGRGEMTWKAPLILFIAFATFGSLTAILIDKIP